MSNITESLSGSKYTSLGSQATLIGALGVALLAPGYAHANVALMAALHPRTPTFQVDGTLHTTNFRINASHSELFTQINRVYDYLLAERVELDDEAHKVLYSNLWELYE
jgi:hypothetical protein